ncbi:MAG: DUF4838 domain-containing protein [Armatimonadota bacterium]
MKVSIAIIIAMLSAASIVNAATGIKLADNGKAQAVIVLGPDASASDRTAADQLASYLKMSTGADFRITNDMPANGPRILIGQTAYTRNLLKDFDWKQITRDGIVIKTIGDDLILAGDPPRGSIYAVITFLENQLGVRWWAPDAETVPKHRKLKISSLDVVYKPPFMYREAFFQAANTDNADFPMHLKLNGHHQRIPLNKGGHYSILGWCHTFYSLLPPDKYFKEHPEWYGQLNGTRTPNWSQLCLTNPEMKDELVKQALARIKENPDAGIISISQNDWYGPCECPKCTELVKETGAQSGALITFVNSVAEEIEKQYPDFLVETLAYQYTRQAPTGVKPRHNVIVRLCSIECNFAQPLNSKANASFYRDLTSWRKIAQRLYVWDYIVNFANYFIPHPNFHALAPNIRTFAKNNVVGLFEQGDTYNPSAALNPLKTWMVAHLMWNPSLDDQALIKEFMNGYYGPAGPYMEQYLQALTDAVNREKPNLTCYISKPQFYSIDDLNKANIAMNSAIKAVKNNAVLLKRVKIQQMALNNLLIITNRNYSEKVKNVNWNRIAKDFLSLADATGNIYSSEGVAMTDSYRQMLPTQLIEIKPTKNPAPPAPGKAGVDWLDFQEKQFSLANEGMWVTIVPDEQSSNGITSRMPGNTTQWAVQHHFTKKEIIAPVVDVVVSIKVDANGTTGNAFSYGVYDPANSVNNMVNIPAANVKNNGYNEYRLNDIAIKSGMYIYAAPCANGAINSVSVDRMYIVKSSK